jgi:O-antigen/teichoic acid export membrane protein
MDARVAIRSLGWSAVETVVSIGMSFLTLLVIARAVGPAEFGLFTVALAVAAIPTGLIAQLFTEAIVQREDLRPEHVDTAFWTAAAVGVVGAAACAGIGWIMAETGRVRLGTVLAWLGLCPLLEGLGATLAARMRRDFAFRRIAIRTAVGRLAGSAVGLGAAAAGVGVWALVAQNLVGAAVALAAVWLAATDRPRARWSAARLRDLLQVAGPSSGVAILWLFHYRLFPIVVGWLFGATAAGHLGLAMRLTDVLQQMSLGVARKVALPVLARRQDDPEGMASGFAAATERTVLLAAPLFVGLAVTAPVAVPLVLGPGWEPAIPAIQVLSLSCVLAAAMQFQPTVLTAIGRAGLNLAAPALAVVVAVAAVVASAPFGPGAAPVAWAAAFVATLPLNLVLLRRATGIAVGDQLRCLPGPLAATAAMAAAVLGVDAAWLRDLAPLPRLAGQTAAGAAVYGATVMLVAPRVPAALFRSVAAGLRA